jgi:hypothetical protein
MTSEGDETSNAGAVQLVVVASVAGAIAGFATGLIDALWSSGDVSQFVYGLGGRLRFTLYLALSYGTFGFILLGLTALGGFALWHHTRLSALFARPLARFRASRDSDPAQALGILAAIWAGLPAFAFTLWQIGALAQRLLLHRKRPDLVIIAAGALGILALCAAIIAGGASPKGAGASSNWSPRPQFYGLARPSYSAASAPSLP